MAVRRCQRAAKAARCCGKQAKARSGPFAVNMLATSVVFKHSTSEKYRLPVCAKSEVTVDLVVHLASAALLIMMMIVIIFYDFLATITPKNYR